MKFRYLCEISKIQPSQFYINKKKLAKCKEWIKSHEDIVIPIAVIGGRTVALDGHTRLRMALEMGFVDVYVELEEHDKCYHFFVDETIKRGIKSVHDMETISDADYEVKWNKFCKEYFENEEWDIHAKQ